MTRIIGGAAGGRRLRTPPGEATRPTSDRVREALFSTLESMLGPLEGRVLDLYAGSGALGLEALSRGATLLTAVESDRRTARLIGDNARSLGFRAVEVVALPVARALSATPRSPYDVVLADPPYPLSEVELAQALALLAGSGWLASDGVLVVERSARSPEPTWPTGWSRARHKTYGETALWYVRADLDLDPDHDLAHDVGSQETHQCVAPSAPDPSIPSPTVTSTSSGGPPGSSTR